jgi:hypothetical protein
MTKLLPALAASLCLCAPPDLLPEGMTGIPVVTRLAAGALDGNHCFAYVVQQGDTLSAISKRLLGDEARWKEIVPLNPGLQADKLTPNRYLWLPPKNPGAPQKEFVYVFFTSKHMKSEIVEPFVPGAEVTVRRGPVGVYLVPAAEIVAFETARAQRLPGVGAFVSSGKVQALEIPAPGHLVPRGDPTQRRDDTLSVEKNAAGKLVLSVKSVAYDKDGKVLVLRPAGQTGNSPEPKKELLLLLLALGGGAVLLWRARRARPAPAMA